MGQVFPLLQENRHPPYYDRGYSFSSVLFYNAKSVAAVENDGYYYCENEEHLQMRQKLL